MISSELLTDLLSSAGESGLEPTVQARLQTLVDAVPVAWMEFRVQYGRLLLVAANAAARRMPGLGAVRTPGVDASEVFDLLADTPLIASGMEGCIFVIESHKTRASMAQVALDRLTSSRARVVGGLLTMFDSKRAEYGYGYEYGYNYGETGRQAG